MKVAKAHKKTAVATAVVLVLALLMPGTYAWAGYNQHKVSKLDIKTTKHSLIEGEYLKEARQDWANLKVLRQKWLADNAI